MLRKPPIALTIMIGAGVLAAFVSGGCTTGKVYVSQPQVNTRERLVSQRLNDTEWLRRQYEEVDKITSTQQGIQDLRAFSGLYAEVAAQVNPSQGKLGSLDIQNKELSKRAENWRLKEEEEKAHQAYLARVNNTSGAPAGTVTTSPATPGATTTSAATPGTPTPGGTGNPTTSASTTSTPSTGAPKGDAETPAVTTPLGTQPGLPSPTSPARTEAKPMLLDLLHDRMAYRDTLNAMVKARELDDAHDQSGMMLYDLNFNLAVVPGDRNSQYVQVTLSLKPDERDRKLTFHELFAKWLASLQATMADEIGALQSRYIQGTLDDVDRQNLERFFTSYASGVRLRLQDHCRGIKRLERQTQELVREWPASAPLCQDAPNYQRWRQDCYESITDHRQFRLLGAMLDFDPERRDSRTPVCRAAMEKFQKSLSKRVKETDELAKDFNDFAQGCPTVKMINSLRRGSLKPEPDLKVRTAVLRGIAWAVWCKYSHELARIVEIGKPMVKGPCEKNPDSYQLNGLEITPVVAAERPNTDPSPRRAKKSGLPGEVHSLCEDMGISSAGECAFVERLSRYENQLYALAVEPTEYAQNISDVAARETLVNLVAVLQVMFPPQGVTANTRFQDLQRSQETLHAIERRPLLASFGMGESRFGWVAGPKFAIRNGRPEFLHTPLRHDCSASIVVPSWLMRVKLHGTYTWIQEDGVQGPSRSLWGPEGLTVNLPRSRDSLQQITLALTASGPSDESFLLTTRPRPRIEDPNGHKTLLLQARSQSSSSDKNPAPGPSQSLVICGHELWRSPQVFVGSQKASRVEVLSDMEGIQAHFDNVVYPGRVKDANTPAVPVDLLVVTAFGQVRKRDAIQILPPPVESKPAPASKSLKQATLKTTFIDSASPTLFFSCPRPESYASLFVKIRKRDSGDVFDKLPAAESWNDKNTEVSFTFPDKYDGPGQVMVADLVLSARPQSKEEISLLKDGPASFVRFRSPADRSLQARTTSIAFFDGTADGPIELSCPVERLSLAEDAYPGFKEAQQKPGMLRLTLCDADGRNGPQLPLRVKERTSTTLFFEVPREDLAQNAARILTKGEKATWQIGARLAEMDIPIPGAGSKSAEISFFRPSNTLTASVDPATVLCKDPDKAGRMTVKITKGDDFAPKYKGLDKSIREKKEVTILFIVSEGSPIEFSVKPEDTDKGFLLSFALKDLLTADRMAKLTGSRPNAWKLALRNDDAPKPIGLWDTNNGPLTVTFQQE